MGAAYPCLRYPANVTGAEVCQPGQLLGWDEIGRPYEVIDAEFIPDAEGSETGHTNVFLQYATPETIRAAQAAP